MEAMLIQKLDQDWRTNQKTYFFSFLSDRFTYITELWAKELSDRFGGSFEPIYVLPYKHNKRVEEDNFIVLNKRLFELQEKLNRQDLIELIYPEELNKQFTKSLEVQELIDQLSRKQERVFILPFTSVWLQLKNRSKVKILGPKGDAAAIFDDKAEHVRTFKRLGLITNEVELYASYPELKAKQKIYPFYFSAAYSSGGFESTIIRSVAELETFYQRLRPVNRNGPFIAAKLLENIMLAPNVSAMVVDSNRTIPVCVSDQLLRDEHYMGNIYPTLASPLQQSIMTEAVIKIGNHMSTYGFRGMFGVDFLVVKEGGCYPTDINPRRQGGYFCNIMMARKINLVRRELQLALGEIMDPFETSEVQVGYAWAHHKLAPYYRNVMIKEDFIDGRPSDPFNQVGSNHKAIYYPKNHVLISGNPGFYVISGYDREVVRCQLEAEVDQLVSTIFERRVEIDALLDVPRVHNQYVKEVLIEKFHTFDTEGVKLILADHVVDPNGVRKDEIDEIIHQMLHGRDRDNREIIHLVAHDKAGNVIGCIGYSLIADEVLRELYGVETEIAGEILHLFVSKDVYRGGGVGTRLFSAVCQELSQRGKLIALFDVGIRYRDSWGFFDQIGAMPGKLIPDRYGPGIHAKTWQMVLDPAGG